MEKIHMYLVLVVKRNALILYSHFHPMFMFLLLVSVTFYRYMEKSHSIIFATFLNFCGNLVEAMQKHYCWHLFVSLAA